MGASGSRQQVGRRGEDLAAAELERQGLRVIARNWRCRTGEIDLIAVETVQGVRTVVFCEVKCRTGRGFGDPLESITYAKRHKLRKLAGEWLVVSGVRPDGIRIDAIGVVLEPRATPVLTHVRGIDA